ncbi:hypothetical protein GCM10010145_33480 [Streptomyces ruber]|uniref:Transcriptional regulator n=2 Tax=Streptomyces TaxID=1883 RepID=A0A918BD64_9ACTN|nr:BTAD domain-containing putative transcriptional regulator [Streptomyces ruber]GGQ60662.1 hypothetical protein GCM10010145_33480 [Streptomyces ruber]
MSAGRLGESLRAARVKAGLTQEEVARRAGVSVRTLRHIERGQVRSPRAESLDRVARVVGYELVPAPGVRPGGGRTDPSSATLCEVRLLGPMTVLCADTPVPMPPKLRALLGLLALQADQVVRHDEIAEVLWPDEVPPGYANLLHTYAGRLRHIFGRGTGRRAGERRIGTVRGGYVFDSGDVRLDLRVFEERVARAAQTAASDPAAALDLYGRALRGRQGRLLQDVPQLWQHPAAVRVIQRHVDIAIDCADLALRLNRPGFAVEHLTPAAHEEPLHESLQARMMLALAGSGRRAAALHLFADLRTRLRRELGVEPSDEMWRARYTVLTMDTSEPPLPPRRPGIAAPAPRASQAPQALPASSRHPRQGPSGRTGSRSPRGGPVPAEVSRGSDDGARVRDDGPSHGRSAVAPEPVRGIAHPAQLPPMVTPFTGRELQLRALDELMDLRGADGAGVGIGVVHGPAEIGKTALAVRWAHRRRGEFPDGQLYADLRGSTGRPVPVLTVLVRALRSLGVRDEWLPDTVEEASVLLRSLVAGRRFLMLLDDVAHPEQVRALLPGTPGNLVLATSRSPLMDLVTREGATPVPVGPLAPAESYALLEAHLGVERTAAEPDATAELAALCGHLPLALRTAAARFAARPPMSVRAAVAELSGAGAAVPRPCFPHPCFPPPGTRPQAVADGADDRRRTGRGPADTGADSAAAG